MISPRTRILLTRILAFLLTMLIGALLFLATEGKNSKASEEITINIQSLYNMSTEDYEQLLGSVRNDTYIPGNKKIPWTFPNSMYFVLVLITTIGYGHLCPETWQGQVFCIFFSLIGIPITAIMLKSIGQFITRTITELIIAFERNVLKNEQPENLERKCFIASIVLMIIMLISGAAITNASEGWSMMEGVYFTFVTLTTIGFGDYVVNDGEYLHKNMIRTVITQINMVFLLLGLGVVSSVLCSISQLLEAGGLSCCERRNRDVKTEDCRVETTEVNEISH